MCCSHFVLFGLFRSSLFCLFVFVSVCFQDTIFPASVFMA